LVPGTGLYLSRHTPARSHSFRLFGRMAWKVGRPIKIDRPGFSAIRCRDAATLWFNWFPAPRSASARQGGGPGSASIRRGGFPGPHRLWRKSKTVERQRHIVIEPSILSADFARLGEQARETEAAGAEAIQIDVMDGHFVPNLTFGPGIVRALRPLVKLKLDVHLMIDNPDSFLEEFAAAGADRLVIHQEVCCDPGRTLRLIRELGMQAGIALNPGTPVRVLEGLLDPADVIQIMTVQPGFGGQKFLPGQLEKIRQLQEMLRERGRQVPIAVDGGIDRDTAPQVAAAGATVLIAGSAVFNRSASVKENISSLLSAAERGAAAA
jgi:ribulose-phosphate 3-epimerase